MSVSERPVPSVPADPADPADRAGAAGRQEELTPPTRRRGRRAKRPVPGQGTTAAGAFGWSLANTMVTRLGTLAIGIILARVLGPEQFGTFAVALVALMAVLSFNELGVSLAIVRWPGNPKSIAGTVNTISLASSALLCAAAWWAAPAYTQAMGSPEATDVVRLLILSVLINGAVAGPAALLQRDFREKTRMGIDLANVWTGTVLSLVLALAGMGAMSLAIGRLSGSLIAAVLFVRAAPLPYRLAWNRDYVGKLLRFGLPLAGTSAIVFGVGYADQLTVGAVLGPVALGFYVLAFNLSSWPVSIVSEPLRRVAPAAFSVLQRDPERLRDVMLKLMGLLAAATVPAFLAIAGAAVPVVDLVYGEAWVPAAAALSWLVVAAMVKILCELSYDVMVVIGRTGTVFWIQCASLVVMVPALVLGAMIGDLAGVAAVQAGVSLLVVLPLYIRQLRHVGIRFPDVLRLLWLPALTGLAAGATTWWLAVTVENTILALVLGATVTLGIIVASVYRHRGTLRLLTTIGSSDRTETPA
ncbi:lipopolysaccharide biosynthesis protein [Citricoccus sp. NPDC079358]|uniref:lipopolysaccharide biosynthesis protein n=1 Tax=Citricoccus sp. NPDC079358 TaxID=3154653 RepID=UPI00344E31E8